MPTAADLAYGLAILANPVVAASIVIPILGCLLNLIFRKALDLNSSPASDSVLLLIVLDGTMAIQATDFSRLVPWDLLRSRFQTVSVILLFVTLLLWVYIVGKAEKGLDNYLTQRVLVRHGIAIQGSQFPYIHFGLAWVFTIMSMAAHVALFSVHGPN